jgi:hypothetical protein
MWPAGSSPLLVQGDDRINTCRAAGWEDGSGKRDRLESCHHGAKDQRIGGSDAIDLILQRPAQRNAPASPSARPLAPNAAPSHSTNLKTLPAVLPNAMRMPISLVGKRLRWKLKLLFECGSWRNCWRSHVRCTKPLWIAGIDLRVSSVYRSDQGETLMVVRREGPRVSVTAEDDRILWSGRTDALPPEHIVYPDDGKTVAKRVDRCTDTELIHAVEQISRAQQT